MFAISHHLASVSIHGFVFDVGLPSPLVDCTDAIIISQNERVSHTIAGTKASHINSLILKLSESSHHHAIRLDPATNRNVKRGENTAYIQSFTALTMSIDISARVSSPNTANIMVLTIDVWTILSAADAISTLVSSFCISWNLNIEYP